MTEDITFNMQTLGYEEIFLGLLMSITSSVILAILYKETHSGLSYSKSFTHTVVFVGLIVAIVMMVVSGSLSRAFALVGAMSIIRFRTVLKDTRDVSFIFASLALGMAAGVLMIEVWLMGLIFVVVIIFTASITNFGSVHKSEYLLKLRMSNSITSSSLDSILNKTCKSAKLLHMEPSLDGEHLFCTYDLNLKNEVDSKEFTNMINSQSGIDEVTFIVSKNDLDY